MRYFGKNKRGLFPFPSRKKQQYKQSYTHDEDNGFVLIEIMEKGVAVLVSIIPQGNEDTIPECNSDCGKRWHKQEKTV